MLLELVVVPPAGADSTEYLSRVLSLGSTELDAALVALESVGLAERRGAAVFGSAAALYFEHLWPVRPMSAVHKEVLALLLDHHPALLAVEEIVRHLAPEPATFGERDSVAVAIRELAQAGLAHRLDRFVFATAAAVGFREVEDV